MADGELVAVTDGVPVGVVVGVVVAVVDAFGVGESVAVCEGE